MEKQDDIPDTLPTPTLNELTTERNPLSTYNTKFSPATSAIRSSNFLYGTRGWGLETGGALLAGTLILHRTKTPASAGAEGVKGEIAMDANFLYICTATNTWTRVALAW